ncbi:MAG: hypothetical protein R2883_07795 [Caldisericia bacterium]
MASDAHVTWPSHPKHIYAHGWWTINSERSGKSRETFVRPHEEVAGLVEAAGVSELLAKDAFRYFIFRNSHLVMMVISQQKISTYKDIIQTLQMTLETCLTVLRK